MIIENSGIHIRLIFDPKVGKFVIQELVHTIAGNVWLDYNNLRFDDASSAIFHMERMKLGIEESDNENSSPE
jgi:hypothetical protein